MPVMDIDTPITPAPTPRKRRTGLLIAAAAAAVLVVGGIVADLTLTGGNSGAAVAAHVTPSSTYSWTPMTFAPDAPSDPNGQQACDQIAALIADDSKTLSEDDLQPVIDAGSKSSDAGVVLRSLKLADARDAAKAAGPKDIAANVNLLTAGIELETACVQAGLSQ